MRIEDTDLQNMIAGILASRKYRDMGLNPATIEDVFRREAPRHKSEKTLRKSVRRILHNIIAPYLGEPGYATLQEELTNIENPSPDSPKIQAFCREVLSTHASTAERLPQQTEFYAGLFEITGKPGIILDLACGLNPLAFPWMGLTTAVEYYAYDIVQPRIDLINSFFKCIGLEPLAENRDILVNPPTIHADLGIFFKEAHRMEKRRPGCNRGFWANLNVDYLAVSLPTRNLSGTHSLIEQHRKLVRKNLPYETDVEELHFEDEIVFLIENPGKGGKP